MAIGSTAGVGDYEVTINGEKVAVQSMTVEYTGNTGSYVNGNGYNYNWNDPYGGSATITTSWPPLEMEKPGPIVFLDCQVCDEATEYVEGLALCSVCLEVMKEMRNHHIIGQIAEIME